MRNDLFEAKYYETYFFANMVQKIIRDPFPYIRELEGFLHQEDYSNFIGKFPKFSVLHQFIGFIIDIILYQSLSSIDIEELRGKEERYHFIPSEFANFRELPISQALKYHDIEHDSFETWLKHQGKTFEVATEDDSSEYFQELRLIGTLDILLEHMTEEVFFLMFLNREILKKFNEMIAKFIISDIYIDDLPEEEFILFKRDGVLKRANIPTWVRRAVFHRDRGRCTLCNQDISGLISVNSQKHFDHIVPLANSGLNDVTNVQLLCERCNHSKGARNNSTSSKYEKWY